MIPDIVKIGNLRLTFAPGLSQAERVKLVSKAEKVGVRASRPTRPAITAYGKSAKPTAAMLKASGERVHGDYGSRPGQPGEPMLTMSQGMPEPYRDAMIAQAERELAKWERDDPHGHGRFMARLAKDGLEGVSTERLEAVVASILRPGGRVVGTFAASLIYGLAELDRRKGLAA